MLYCWFDWEDDTTTVNSINIIREPRKPYEDYKIGETITAKLPQYSGLWKGVIVDIHESRQALLNSMKERQTSGHTAISDEQDAAGEKALENPGPTRKRKAAQSPQRGRKRTQSCSSSDKEHIKKKSKELKDNTLQARKMRLDEIISTRQQTTVGVLEDQSLVTPFRQQEVTPAIQEQLVPPPFQEQTATQIHLQAATPIRHTTTPIQQQTVTQVHQETPVSIYQQTPTPVQIQQQTPTPVQIQQQTPTPVQIQQQTVMQQEMSSGLDSWQWGNGSFSYMNELTKIYSYSELQEQNQILTNKNAELEEQNQRLKDEIAMLKEHANQSVLADAFIPVTPRKLRFMKQLITELESRSRPTSSAVHQTDTTNQCPASLQTYPTPTSSSPGISSNNPCTDLSTDSPIQIPDWEKPITGINTSVIQPRKSAHAADAFMENGLKKVQLVSGHNVFLTQSKLSTALLIGDSARKLTISLLDCLFGKDHMSRSCAKGTRKAHNSTITTQPLPETVLSAILEFVLRKFKVDGGSPAINRRDFIAVVNNKCATARRSLKL